MSLESALDEERREVMALLEGRTLPKPASHTARAQSPAAAQSPVRSMLDIGGPLTSPTSPGMKSPSGLPSTFRSMLDLDAGSPPATPRSLHRPISPSPMGNNRMGGSSLNPEEAYQFEMLPSIEAHALPKRVTQGGKKQKQKQKSQITPRSMASVYGNPGELLGAISNRGKHNSSTGILGKKKSKSPSNIPAGGRSSSPGGRMLNTNSFNLMSDPNKYHTDSGKVIDMTNAYRRLSDAALVRSGGSLANLPSRKGADPSKGESVAPDGGVRLEKDYYADDDEDAVETSDEDDLSSDGEGWDSEGKRGRRRTRGKSQDSANMSAVGEGKKPKSLLAAAEDERKEVSATYTVRSLLEPTVTITSPDGEKMTSKKSGVHPHTSFDQGGSGLSTPMTSDTEADISEIKTAQKMALNISPIHSTPEAHRCVRQILRGEYRRFQQDADQGLRRQRVYLVATDLSEEAAYALEWTIGTVLRDGDTLLAVYAVDEEMGTGMNSSIGIGEGAHAMQAANSLVKSLATEQSSSPGPSPLAISTTLAELEKQPDLASMDKAERERWKATAEVSDRCVKLLRKTKLQVRVVVEVFHCKSPKHMITEVIDFLEPTLVILGSRGRSALKGVLLGSFSNYLVTKSSVPVMVARKRLRKHSKYKRTNLRLSNVLTNPTSRLVNAKID